MSTTWVRRLAGLASAAAAVWLVGGCYHKIVGAQGFGADQVQIEQGNLDSGPKTLGYPSFQHKPMPGSN